MMPEALSVLVVEDEALLRMQLVFMVEDSGHQVVATAASYKEAVEAIGRNAIDLALVDIHLSDGPTGLDVGRRLGKAGIPFMFVTANGARVPEDFCGAWGVIDKPYGEGAIVRALRFVAAAVHNPPPPMPVPQGMRLSPAIAALWAD